MFKEDMNAPAKEKQITTQDSELISENIIEEKVIETSNVEETSDSVAEDSTEDSYETVF